MNTERFHVAMPLYGEICQLKCAIEDWARESKADDLIDSMRSHRQAEISKETAEAMRVLALAYFQAQLTAKQAEFAAL